MEVWECGTWRIVCTFAQEPSELVCAISAFMWRLSANRYSLSIFSSVLSCIPRSTSHKPHCALCNLCTLVTCGWYCSFVTYWWCDCGSDCELCNNSSIAVVSWNWIYFSLLLKIIFLKPVLKPLYAWWREWVWKIGTSFFVLFLCPLLSSRPSFCVAGARGAGQSGVQFAQLWVTKKWMMTQFLLHDGDRQHLQGWRCWWWKVRFLQSVGLTTACRQSLGPRRTIVSTHCGRSARADPPWRLQSSQQATQPPWPLHNHSPTLAAHANTQTHVPACLREREQMLETFGNGR